MADVRLNRPDKLNALDGAMFDALIETSDALALDSAVRCVVLSGEGASFCAGLDFASFAAMAGAPEGAAGALASVDEGRITHRAQQAVYGWTEMPAPVIAAVRGHAIGGGVQLALGADIRFVHPDATLSVLETRWGLIPDMTGTQSLVRLVGLDVAKELVWTGRMVSGKEAVAIGLATHLADDPLAASLELASEIAARSPDATRAAKRLLSRAAEVGIEEGFARERAEIQRLIGSPNQVESVTAYFERRSPRFVNPS